jgi:hypothetical protein
MYSQLQDALKLLLQELPVYTVGSIWRQRKFRDPDTWHVQVATNCQQHFGSVQNEGSISGSAVPQMLPEAVLCVVHFFAGSCKLQLYLQGCSNSYQAAWPVCSTPVCVGDVRVVDGHLLKPLIGSNRLQVRLKCCCS